MKIQSEGRKRREGCRRLLSLRIPTTRHVVKTDLAEAHWFGCSYVITRVAQGKADVTDSFVLSGMDENDEKFTFQKD